MGKLSKNKPAYSLYELNNIIKSSISNSFPDAYWVTAEIADFKCNQKGHCYIELVEKKEDKTLAQMRATIWAYEYRKLILKFQKATNESLKPGMKVLLLAVVNFHEVFGLSLNVRDIDPTYTMGEMARKKKEVIDRLKKEGIIDLNKELSLPLVPQRIAVISSPAAAGYGDFFNQIDNNFYRYKFIHILFPALMQGHEAETSILSALNKIKKKQHLFDVVVIIRGGGSSIDLNCFDSYTLASQISRFPLPVITGIGHEKDDTVTDIVAHTKLKTPTAVAEFLISGILSFEEKIIDSGNKIKTKTERLLKDAVYRLDTLSQRLTFMPLQITASHNNTLSIHQRDLLSHTKQLFQQEENRFNSMEQALRLLTPANVLRRGYSITRYRGKVLKNESALKKWAVIETRLYKGTVTSIVQQQKKEDKESGQEQKADLLPGFD
jgi:exodeoxyribonuclease VII large subunit